MAVNKWIVPDASVLLKWVLPQDHEADFQQAWAIREAYIQQEIGLLVPTVWIYEAGNLLGRKYPDEANDMLNTLESFNVTTQVYLFRKRQIKQNVKISACTE